MVKLKYRPFAKDLLSFENFTKYEEPTQKYNVPGIPFDTLRDPISFIYPKNNTLHPNISNFSKPLDPFDDTFLDSFDDKFSKLFGSIGSIEPTKSSPNASSIFIGKTDLNSTEINETFGRNNTLISFNLRY